MTKIVLDADAFKALASDTRLQILKALDARPLTVSELSRLLDLNKATVFEHLKQLLAADLAKREDDPARKWVYYRLTWKGKNVLHPENAQIFIMLGLAAFGVGGAVLQTAYLAQMLLGRSSSSSISEGPASPSTASENQPFAPAAASSGSPSASSSAQQDASHDQMKVGSASPVQREAPAAGNDHHWYEAFASTQFLIVVGLLVFLLLVALIVWTLYQDQRRERREMARRIHQLPSDVNAGELPATA